MITLHYLIGDVHTGGHDVHRVAKNIRTLLQAAGGFDITMVCDEPWGDISFDDYFARELIYSAEVIVFNCGNYRFNVREEQVMLERAVSHGAGFVFLHGDHPCYWGKNWEGFERMAMLLWRDKTSHGDFADAEVRIDRPDHPITVGMSGFHTRDEIFCTMENPYNVPTEVLASAYSDAEVISRHGARGTGNWEGCAIVGSYGKGRLFNLSLGHVWPCYTGHGLGENTNISFRPRQLRQMIVRGCEWAATGDTARTRSFDGAVQLT